MKIRNSLLIAMPALAGCTLLQPVADDHALARKIGTRLERIKGVADVLPVETNIVIFDLSPKLPEARDVASSLRARGITVTVVGKRRIRIVTHMGVGSAEAEILISALEELAG